MNPTIAREHAREMRKGYEHAVESGIPEHELKVVLQSIMWCEKQAAGAPPRKARNA